jgi:hypothetical protein
VKLENCEIDVKNNCFLQCACIFSTGLNWTEKIIFRMEEPVKITALREANLKALELFFI